MAPDGLIEGIATVGSGVAGGIAGAVGGLWDAVTGEDYETARETQDRISGALTWNPVSDGGKEAVASIGEAMDNPLFNYLGETGEAWGQNTNDYLMDTPLAAAAPAAGILASMGPDIAAGVATGGAGAAGARVARLAGSEVFDGVQDVAKTVGNKVDDRKARKAREERFAPALLRSIDAEADMPSRSMGSAETELARRNVELAADMPYPITLTQGQATRNAAQMSDEFNLIAQADRNDVAPLENLKAQQQRDLHQNLAHVRDTLDRAEPAMLSSDEALGRSIKDTLERRRAERKEKTGALYQAAEEAGDMDTMISVSALDDAFGLLEQRRFNRTEPAKMKLLQTLADDIGVSGGRPARIRDVEEFRQQINSVLNDVTNPNHNQMAGILKQSVDDALDIAPDSAEAYKRARAAYSRDKTAFEGNALISNITGKKGRTKSDALQSDKVYQKLKTGDMSDVTALMREMSKTEGGVNMIHTVGARLMNDLIEASRKSGVDGDGGFNSARLSREIKKLDQSGRLEAIYGPQRAEALRRVADVGEIVNSMPYGNTANFPQSGNTMVKQIADIIGRAPIPLLSRGAKMTGNAWEGGVLRQRQQNAIKKALDVEGLLSYE